MAEIGETDADGAEAWVPPMHADCPWCGGRYAITMSGTLYRHGPCEGSGWIVPDPRERLVALLGTVLTRTPPAPPERRCMGRRCPREAEVEVRTIDPTMAAHEHSLRLCSWCLGDMPVDIFRWLSDNRIEADR